MLLGQWSGRYDIPSPSCVVIFGDRVCGKSSCVVEAQGTASGGVFFDNAHTQLLCSERRSSPCVWLRKAPVFAAVEGGKSGVTFKLPSRQRCEDCTGEGHFRGVSVRQLCQSRRTKRLFAKTANTKPSAHTR